MPELLVAWVAFPAIQLLLWLGCGCLAGRAVPGAIPRSLLAPLGFCVVVVAGGFTSAVPGIAPLTTPLVVVLAIAGLLLAPPWRGGRPSQWLVAALAVVFVVYAAPIVLSGSATFAGYIRLDDTATWLALTDRVMEAGRDLDGLAPSSYEATLAFNLADGYPVGAFIPLGVGQALTGLDTAWLVQPYMALLAVLLALALWDLAGRLVSSERARAGVVALAAQPALLYGYYLWGGVKELAAAMLIALVACAAGRAMGPDARLRDLVPVALGVAALVSCLSLAGAVWLGPLLLGALVLAILASSPGRVAVRSMTLVVLVALLIAPVLLGGALVPPTSSPLDDPEARGNLVDALSPLQALGIWPAGDFRVDPDEMSVTLVLCVFAGVAAAGGCVAAVLKRRWDLVAYLVGVPAAALVLVSVGSPWVGGKALAIASPTILFAAFLGCAWAWVERRQVIGLGVASFLAAGVVWSNALAYSDVSLAPRDQLAELEEIGEMIEGEGPALMTEYQPYGVRHFLREADPEGASELRRRLVPLADGASLEKGLWADTDDFRDDALEPYEALVLRRSPQQSRPPGAFELAWSGEYYELWTRDGASPRPDARIGLGEGRSPVAIPVCTDVRGLADEVPGGELVAAASVEPLFAEADISGSNELSAEIEAPAGNYTIWLGGSVHSAATLSVDGEAVETRGRLLNNEGLYTELGEVDLDSGAHTVTVEFADVGLAPGSGGAPDLGGPIALVPAETEAEATTVNEADWKSLCGKPWDWIEAVP